MTPGPKTSRNLGSTKDSAVNLNVPGAFNSAAPSHRRAQTNVSPLPGIQDSTASLGGDGGFFLTGVHDNPSAMGARTAQPKAKLSLPISPVKASPSARNFERLAESSYGTVSAIPMDVLLNSEKRKIVAQSARSRSIQMMGQIDKKKRQMLEKSIDKKQQKAEKTAKREQKIYLEKIHKSNEKSSMVTQKVRQENRAIERERNAEIKEIMQKDQAERDKVNELRRKQHLDVTNSQEADRGKRELAKQRVHLDLQEGLVNLPSRLAAFEEKMASGERRRRQEQGRLIMSVQNRNSDQFLKFEDILEKKKIYETDTFNKFEAAENAKHKRLKKIYKEMNILFTDFKDKRNEKNDLMKTRQQSEEYSRREKAQEMIKKLHRS